MKEGLNAEQKKAASFRKSTVVVASAGTGKTTTLVATYMNLLERGVQPGEILALTFTDKAAGEMRERVRRELLKKVTETQAEPMWRKTLHQIAQAPIFTIHAFCGQIVREQAVWLKVDPQYTILEEPQANMRLDHAVWTVLNEEILANDPATFSLIELYDFENMGKGGVVDLLKFLVKGMNDQGIDLSETMERHSSCTEAWVAPWEQQREQEVAGLRSRFELALEEIRETFTRLFSYKTSIGKRTEQYLARLRENQQAIEEALSMIEWEGPTDVAACIDLLSDFTKTHRIADKPENLPLLRDCAILKRYLGKDAPFPLVAWFGAKKSLPHSRQLELLARKIQDRYHRDKEQSHLDFSDLLINARRLLRTNPALRKLYKQRYKALLVDEFQDTDSIQAEIILLLAEADGTTQEFDTTLPSLNVVKQASLSPQKLFVVGDAKQSIYGFRGADVAVFRAVSDKVTSLGHPPVPLRENYRSVSDLINFTNRFFTTLLPASSPEKTEDPLHSYYTTFSEEDCLFPQKNEAGQKPGKILLLTADPSQDAQTARENEAHTIAGLIRQWMSEGLIAQYKDIALLFQTRTKMAVYQHALRKLALPHYLVKAGRFFDQLEVVEMIHLLSFLRDPGDDLALAQVASSAMGGLSFADLAQIASQSKEPSLWEKFYQPSSTWSHELKEKVRCFVAFLNGLLVLRDRLQPHEILQKALEKTAYDTILMAMEEGEARVANAEKLIELTRALSRESRYSLDDCVDRIREMSGSGNVEPEAPLYGEEENVIRLITVHQAKGLEFEVVIVPNLGGKSDTRGPGIFLDPKRGALCEAGYGLDQKKVPNLFLQEARRHECQREEEEEKRLLYVALTRAKRILVLGEGYRKKAQGRWLGYLDKANLMEGIETIPSKAFGTDAEALPPLQKNTETCDGLKKGMYHAFSWRPSPPEEIHLSPSQLEELAKCERYFFLTHIAGLREYPPFLLPSGPDSKEQGVLAHRVLELLDPGQPSESWGNQIQAIVNNAPQSHHFSAEEREKICQSLLRFQQSPQWRRRISSEGVQREIPFAFQIKGEGILLTVEGKIDLLVPGSIPVLGDYKYATRSTTDPKKYEIQINTYAFAVFKRFGVPKILSEIYFLLEEEGGCVAREINNPYCIEQKILSLGKAYSGKIRNQDLEVWTKADQAYCNQIACGFRGYCWGREGSGAVPDQALKVR